VKEIELDLEEKCEVRLKIWDKKSEEHFKPITPSFFAHCGAILLLFDFTDRTSFTEVNLWLSDVARASQRGQRLPVILIATELDLELDRKMTFLEASELANTYNLNYFETSAKYASNVEATFLFAAEYAVKHQMNPQISSLLMTSISFECDLSNVVVLKLAVVYFEWHTVWGMIVFSF
jgi:GTPase SAR1 family protein